MTAPFMPWCVVDRCDPAAVSLANRHYSRRRWARTVGPPGAPVVLRPPEGDALFVVSRSDYARLDGFPTAWANNYFRNESAWRASDLITAALAAVRWVYGDPPVDGIVTYIDPAQVRSTNPGYCYLVAGFEHVRWTEGGHGRPSLRLLHMPADRMPEARQPLALAQTLEAVA